VVRLFPVTKTNILEITRHNLLTKFSFADYISADVSAGAV